MNIKELKKLLKNSFEENIDFDEPHFSLRCKENNITKQKILHILLYDGKLASCSNISRDFIEGNLKKERIKDVWERRYQKFRERNWLKEGDCKECSEWNYCHGGPMHKRLKDGTILDCLYKTIFYGKDYRKELPQEAFTTVAGN